MEYGRLRKEAEDNKNKAAGLEAAIERLHKERQEHDELMTRQMRETVIEKLEAEVKQLERHVKHLKTERDSLKTVLD
jgi:glutamine synthetase